MFVHDAVYRIHCGEKRGLSSFDACDIQTNVDSLADVLETGVGGFICFLFTVDGRLELRITRVVSVMHHIEKSSNTSMFRRQESMAGSHSERKI